MSKTLYISDLDGTLLLPDATVSEYTVNTINRLINNGLNFSVATARTAATCDRLLGDIKLNIPIILMNGVIVYDFKTKKCINKALLSEDAKNKVIDSLNRLGLSAFMYGLEKDTLMTYYDRITSSAMQDFIDERVQNYGKKFTRLDDLTKASSDIIYFCCLDCKENIERLYSEVSKIEGLRVEKYPDIYSKDQSWYMEIFSEKASKKSALEYLKAYCGFDYVVCFGDNLNDLPMYEASDKKIAMRNANDAVKAKADEIIGSNVDSGVARWLCENAVLS